MVQVISLVHGLGSDWLGLLVALPLVLFQPAWRVVKFLITPIHEFGHSAITLVTPGRVRGVRVFADGSATTVAVSDRDGDVGALFQLSGYPAPSLLGLAGLFAVSRGWATWVLVAMVVALGFVLMLIRNLVGLGVLLALLAGVAAALWRLPPEYHPLLVRVLSWLLLLGAVRDAVGQYREVECASPAAHGVSEGYVCTTCNSNDAESLDEMGIGSADGWKAVFLAFSVALAGAGVWLLIR